jgi:hypothetical protein
MPSIVVMVTDDRPAYDASRLCDQCGRRGTFARITRRPEPVDERHYCRRCWPRAHRHALEAQHASVSAWFEAGRVAVEEYFAGRRLTPEIPAPHAYSMAWHWSLIPGTYWREYRYGRRPSDVAPACISD